MLRNSGARYGLVARALHWLTAAAIAGMIAVGLVIADLPRGAEKDALLSLHASSGVTVFVLMTARLVWRLVNRAPAAPEGAPLWQARTASLVHWGLYALVYAQVATGVMTLFTTAASLPFFGLFEIASPYAERDRAAHHLWEERHIFFFWSLAALATVHALAAAWHHLIRKDGVLGRML